LQITIYKCDHLGAPVWHYTGTLIERDEAWMCIEARFGREDVATPYVTFRKGDRMVEWFYTDRWYNIFQIHDVDDDQIKGWYCNITRPAHITMDTISADDLALDVFITPKGDILLDDEDEFELLNLSIDDRAAVYAAVAALRQRVADRAAPFDVIG
jgi:uncharacterized protein